MSHISQYLARQHAMQTGVAMRLESGVSKECEPKHLRVGINTAMTDHQALVELLITKGVITQEEYMEAIAVTMDREASRYEAELGVSLA